MKLKGLLSLIVVMMLITVGCSSNDSKDSAIADNTESAYIQENSENTKEDTVKENTDTGKDELAMKPTEDEDKRNTKKGNHTEGKDEEADETTGASKKMPEVLTFNIMPEKKVAVGTVAYPTI